jgi:hypothetical protein
MISFCTTIIFHHAILSRYAQMREKAIPVACAVILIALSNDARAKHAATDVELKAFYCATVMTEQVKFSEDTVAQGEKAPGTQLPSGKAFLEHLKLELDAQREARKRLNLYVAGAVASSDQIDGDTPLAAVMRGKEDWRLYMKYLDNSEFGECLLERCAKSGLPAGEMKECNAKCSPPGFDSLFARVNSCKDPTWLPY